MPVPEATMDEDDGPAAREDHVGLSRQVLAVEPEAVPHGMDEPAHSKLGLRVLAADTPHAFAALRRGQRVSQSASWPALRLSEREGVFEAVLDGK